MKRLKFILAAAILGYSISSWAQQETLITQFPNHMNIINPAFAGADNETVLKTTLRSQWTGIPEAPETQFFSFSSALGKNIGLGFSAFNDKSFIEKSSQLAIDASYKVQLSQESNLFFGLKGSANFFRLNASGLEVYNVMQDASLVDINNFSPNVGVGLLFDYKKLRLSFGAPRLLTTDRTDQEDGIVTVSSAKPHLFVSAGYEVGLSQAHNILLRPSVLLRRVTGAPVSVDINAMVSFSDVFEIGAMYRTSNAFAGIASLTLSKRLTFGFAYEINTISELAQARNTNELFLSYKFN